MDFICDGEETNSIFHFEIYVLRLMEITVYVGVIFIDFEETLLKNGG